MSKSYIPENKVYAVCTFQLCSGPKKFAHTRGKTSVFYQGSSLVLNAHDRNIDAEFTCKSPVSTWACIAGLAIFASGPIGWIAVGVAAAAVAALVVSVVTHKCTDPLQQGEWYSLHSSVQIDGVKAITGASLLKCKKGGIVTPFFSADAAMQAAKDVAFDNRLELDANVAASFGASYFLLELVGVFSRSATAAVNVKAGAVLFGQLGSGYVAFSVLSWGEKAAIRGWNENVGALSDDENYKNINGVGDNDLFSRPGKSDDVFQDSEDLLKLSRDSRGHVNANVLPAIVSA